MDEFIRENIDVFITIGTTLAAIVLGSLSIQRFFHKQKIERLEESHKIELEKINSKLLMEQTEKPLIQEEKVYYVQYLHIRKESEPAVYKKFIRRLNETIDVHNEYRSFRLNKYSTKNNSISIRDRSSGVVDMQIIYPWRDLIFTDLPSKQLKNILTQDLSGSDTYFTVTTNYNGFNEGNEDIAMKMEMNTSSARLIADFSSIIGLQNLFIKSPDVYKINQNGDKIRISGLEEINEGVFHIHLNNLKKDEVILLDFHINWNYLKNDKC